MECVLCHGEVDLLTLDTEGVGGLPAHTDCARTYRAEAAAVLREAELLVLAERDPARHRATARRACC